MSSLIVEVSRVDRVDPHPNADRMCVCTVKGWRVCAGRDPEAGRNQFEPGDLCVYVPPDAVLPPALAERLGVTKYLGSLPLGPDGNRLPGGRVRVARLRGEPSYGLILKPDDPALHRVLRRLSARRTQAYPDHASRAGAGGSGGVTRCDGD